MKEKKLSIIVPVYNVQKYISDAIDSIILNESNLEDWLEVILVDDGSTDKSGIICDQYALKYSFIKVIHQKNQGLSAARNVALDIANGEWIVFVDSDDIVRENYLSVLLNIIKYNKEADIIIFKYRMFIENNSIKNTVATYSPQKISTLSKSTAMFYITTEEIGNYAWNKIFRKKLFKDIRFPVGKRYEDIAVMHKYFQLANNICLYNDYLYFYRQRVNSILHVEEAKERVNLYRDSVRARSEQISFFKKHNYSRAVKNASHYFVGEAIHYIIWINKANMPKDKEYVVAKKFVNSYVPKISEGKKLYLFVKLYNIFPKFVEEIIKMTN